MNKTSSVIKQESRASQSMEQETGANKSPTSSSNSFSSSLSTSSSASASPSASSSSSSGSNSSSSSNVTAFLSKLWRLVDDQSNNNLICWSQSGCSFVILNQIQFAKDLLPLFFKHNNMASFIRQLNMYGFRKIPLVGSNGNSANLRTDVAQFYHVNFMRGQEQRLACIKRKNNSTKTHNLVVNGSFCDEVRSILNDVRSIRDGQKNSESILSTIQVDNKSLWRDVNTLRSQHHKQRHVIEKLIQFLVSLIHSRNNLVTKKRKLRHVIDGVECTTISSASDSQPPSPQSAVCLARELSKSPSGVADTAGPSAQMLQVCRTSSRLGQSSTQPGGAASGGPQMSANAQSMGSSSGSGSGSGSGSASGSGSGSNSSQLTYAQQYLNITSDFEQQQQPDTLMALNNGNGDNINRTGNTSTANESCNGYPSLVNEETDSHNGNTNRSFYHVSRWAANSSNNSQIDDGQTNLGVFNDGSTCIATINSGELQYPIGRNSNLQQQQQQLQQQHQQQHQHQHQQPQQHQHQQQQQQQQHHHQHHQLHQQHQHHQHQQHLHHQAHQCFYS